MVYRFIYVHFFHGRPEKKWMIWGYRYFRKHPYLHRLSLPTAALSLVGNQHAPEQQGAAALLLAAPGTLRCGISGVFLG